MADLTRSHKTLLSAVAVLCMTFANASCDAQATPQSSSNTTNAKSSGLKLATFGGGCFWCTEAVFERVKGVEKVVSGYSGGFIENPTYKQVCTGQTGHAEVVQITYNSDIISYEDLLEIFWKTH